MYRFCRLVLMIAWSEAAFASLLFVPMFWPASGILLAAAAVYETTKRGKKLWTHSTARWARQSDLRRTSMLDMRRGLRIGRLVADREPATLIPPPGSWIVNRSIDAQVACSRVLRHLAASYRKTRPVVRLTHAVHSCIFGPTGAGKGTSFIIPWLLESDESGVVIDFKGENATITARHREKMFGHRCVLLDPFRVVTSTPDTLNPLDFIDKDSLETLDDCRDLAEQLVIKTAEEREPHWNQSAENWISATIAATVHSAPTEKRSLQTVRDVLSNPEKMAQLIELLCQSDGMLPRLGGQLAFFRDKELASTLTTANRHLRFLDTPAVWESTSSSSFDPRELRKGKMTIYCILPPHHMRAQSALMRMWIGTLLKSVVQKGLQHG